MDKPTLRRGLIAALRALSPTERHAASFAICDLLARDPAFLAAETVFSFLPLPSEPDLRPLLERYPEKLWGLPRVTDGEWMRFHHLASADEAIAGVHGIREPDPMVHPVIEESRVDLVLVPGLGFDPRTHARIGRGRGYYDRFLSRFRGGRRPEVIGISFACQLTPLEPEDHDVPVQRIATERGWA